VIGSTSGVTLGSSCLICLHCVCMFGLFARFVCVICVIALNCSNNSKRTNTHDAIDANAKLSMDSLINVVVIITCKIHQNGSNID